MQNNLLLDNQRWRGRKNGDVEIKNVTSRFNEKTGKREYYLMLDYAMAWFKVFTTAKGESYVRYKGERLYLADFVYENMFETVKEK